MFIYIKHGEDEQFLVNTNCRINILLQYVRAKLGVAESELVDLCDEQGVLKMLFLSQHPQENASQLFTPRETFMLCTINRSFDGSYASIIPHVTNPDPALQEVLQKQIQSIVKTRLKQIREERKTSGENPVQSQLRPPVQGQGRALLGDATDEEKHSRTGSKRNRN